MLHQVCFGDLLLETKSGATGGSAAAGVSMAAPRWSKSRLLDTCHMTRNLLKPFKMSSFSNTGDIQNIQKKEKK